MRAAFDPKAFLAKLGDGKTIHIRRIKSSFPRATWRTRFFTSKAARSSSPSFQSMARKPSWEFWDIVTFVAKGVLMAIPCGSQQLKRSSRPVAMITALHDHPEISELFMTDLLGRNIRIEET
jgi:hypothetical protein